MPKTFNGIGTSVCGERKLTKEEIGAWKKHFPYLPDHTSSDYLIGTESIVALFPFLPIKTHVYYYLKQDLRPVGVSSSQYQILYYPAGEGKIYWKHVKSSLEFYEFPIFITVLLTGYFLFPRLFTTINVFLYFFLFYTLFPIGIYIYNKIKFDL